MSDSMSNYLETALLNATLRNISYTSPTTVYVALFDTTASLADLEAGTLTGEISGSNYSRTAVTFGAPSGGTAANSANVTFPTASGTWGTVRYLAIMDAVTLGNVLYYGQLIADKVVESGDTFTVSTANLTVTLN